MAVPRLRKKMLRCEVCGYKNYQSQAKTFHRHLCEPIKCESCDFETPLKLALLTHMGQQHEPRVHKCNSCPFTTEKSGKLKRHNTIHARPTVQ